MLDLKAFSNIVYLSNQREFLYCVFYFIFFFVFYQNKFLWLTIFRTQYEFFFVATLKHVARTVAHVELIDHVVEVVFTIFDENRT